MIITSTLQETGHCVKDFPGPIGTWGVHTKVHDGHRYLYREISARCCSIVGVYYLNWQYCREVIGGAKHIKQTPLDWQTLKEFLNKCAVIYLMAGTDIGFPHSEIGKRVARAVEQLPDERVPEFIRNDKEQMATLRAAQVFRTAMLEHIPLNVAAGSLKDAWRPIYNVWHREQFPQVLLLETDPIRDRFGNSYCSSMPEDITARITKPLLLPHFTSIEEVREHIKSIDGLGVVFFARDEMTNYMYSQFTVGDRYWNFGIPL